jgi:hypothetical protein
MEMTMLENYGIVSQLPPHPFIWKIFLCPTHGIQRIYHIFKHPDLLAISG